MKVNSSEIAPATSILNMFNGNSQFVIENPWFKFESYLKKQVTTDNYLNSFYTTENNNLKFHQLNTPRILFKDPKKNKFSAIYEIKWGSESPKTYWIMIASKEGIKEMSGNQNFFVNPVNSELSKLKNEDLNLCILDRQLIIGFDIALSLVLLNINPAECENDELLIKAIYEKYLNLQGSKIEDDKINAFINNYLTPFNDIKVKPTISFVDYIQRIVKVKNIEINSPLIDVFKLLNDVQKVNKFKQSFQLNKVENEEVENFYFNGLIKFNMKNDKDNKYQTKLVTFKDNKPKTFNLSVKDMKDMFSEEYPRKTVRFGYIKIKQSFSFKYIDNPEYPSNFTISWTATTVCLGEPVGIKPDDDTQAVMVARNGNYMETDE